MSPTAYREQFLLDVSQARLCHALYSGEGAIRRLTATHGGLPRTFEVGHIRAASLTYLDRVHLVICGTNDLIDWADNFSIRHVVHEGYELHGGYYEAAKTISAAIKNTGLPADIRRRKLILGGHSAGGSISQALSLFSEYRPERVVTFGAPRVVSPQSALYYGALPWRIIRYVRTGDPVAQLPLRIHNYRHPSAPIYLTGNGLRTDEATRRLRDAALWVRAAFGRMVGRPENSRHLMAGYLHALEAAEKELLS